VPRNVFWDDFTGHLYFTLGTAARIVKWHPETGMLGMSIMSPFRQAGVFNLTAICPEWAAVVSGQYHRDLGRSGLDGLREND
jgi:hypothetical protein